MEDFISTLRFIIFYVDDLCYLSKCSDFNALTEVYDVSSYIVVRCGCCC